MSRQNGRMAGAGKSSPNLDWPEADRPGRTMVSVRLTTRLDDLAGDMRCEECGGDMTREYLEHVVVDDRLEVRARQVAGYRCNQCGAATYSHQAILESFLKARELFLRARSTRIVGRIDEAIAYHQQFLAAQGSVVSREVVGAR